MRSRHHHQSLCLWLASLSLSLSACKIAELKTDDGKCEASEENVRGFCIPNGNEVDSGVGADAAPDPMGSPCPEAGLQDSCYTATDKKTALQFPCHAGLRTCTDAGFWGACQDEVTPMPEVCDGKDNNCNSIMDDVTQTGCMVEGNFGQCAVGLALCISGKTQCIETQRPGVEMCPTAEEFSEFYDLDSGIDNDCDGVPANRDPSLAVECYAFDGGCERSGNSYICRGECRTGSERCDGGCIAPIYPRAEARTLINDAGLYEVRDEDCDGEFDEGMGCAAPEFKCYTGPAPTRQRGACRDGTQACTDAGLGACMNDITPKAETCANMGSDDDCNGVLDDVMGVGTACGTASDPNQCEAKATYQCDKGALVCVNAMMSGEVCDNLDNNCNNVVDDCGSKATDTCCSMAGQPATCVDTNINNLHCGGCGKACPEGESCCGGMCKNLLTDKNHCGACNDPCGVLIPGLLAGCVGGVCKVLQ